MAKPQEDYEWATTLQTGLKIDPQTNSSVLILNKEEPDPSTKQGGVVLNGKLARGFLNYVLNALGVHITYLYEGEVGDMFLTANTSTTAAEVILRRGNSWVDLGLDTIGGTSVRVFQRDS